MSGATIGSFLEKRLQEVRTVAAVESELGKRQTHAVSLHTTIRTTQRANYVEGGAVKVLFFKKKNVKKCFN